MTVTASIDIAVSPADVRAKFLDFPALPNYSTTFFGSITPLGPLEPNQKIRVNFAKANQTIDATIKENTPQAFAWTGSIPFLFTGTHRFLFEPSSTVPGGCRFTQSEEFSGALGWLMGENAVARQMGFAEKTRKGWEGFNEEFKAWCERSSSG